MKVAIRESAVNDLERIRDWIAKDNPRAAGSVVDRILDAIEFKIPPFPYMGRAGKVQGTRAWIVRGLPYIIVYQVDDARSLVTIIAIFHGAQNR